MAEILKGDEFNRIQLEVLSVLATIIFAKQDYRKKNQEKFNFSEWANALYLYWINSIYVYFITMNPGYSGRQELPKNLKILFRDVTMMAQIEKY